MTLQTNTYRCFVALTFLMFWVNSGSLFFFFFNSDFTKIKNAYTTKSALFVDVIFEKYVNKVSNTPLEVLTGEACYRLHSTYEMYDSVVSITTPDYHLLVDHNYKRITRENTTDLQSKMMKSAIKGVDFNMFLKHFEVLSYKKAARDSAFYILKNKVGDPQEFTIIFNPSNFRLKEVLMKYLVQQEVGSKTTTYYGYPLVRVLYKNNKKISNSAANYFFDIKNYLVIKDEKLTTSSKYKEYQYIGPSK